MSNASPRATTREKAPERPADGLSAEPSRVPAPAGDAVPLWPLVNRRRVLKATASAIPLVATLPNGAALANASSAQCVINEQQNPGAAPGQIPDAVPPQDSYIRIPGTVDTYTVIGPSVAQGGPGFGTIRVYEYEIDGQTITIVGDNSDQTGARPPLGSWFYVNGIVGEFAPPSLSSRSDALFLRVYDSSAPDPSTGEVTVAVDTSYPWRATDCTIDAPSWDSVPTGARAPLPPTGDRNPQYCVWPIAVPADIAVDGGNIALTASCLTSFIANGQP